MRRAIAWLGLVGRVLTGTLFIIAAITKLFQIQAVVGGTVVGAHVFAYSIIRNNVLPERFAYGVAVATIAAEVAVGAWLLSHWCVRWSSIVAGVMLMAFAAYLGLVYARNVDPSCGCFGTVSASSVTEECVRNGVLLLLLVPSTFAGGIGSAAAKEGAGRR